MKTTEYAFDVYEETNKRRDGAKGFRWRLVSRSNGKIMADSGESYTRRSDCVIAIGRVRRAADRAVIQRAG